MEEGMSHVLILESSMVLVEYNTIHQILLFLGTASTSTMLTECKSIPGVGTPN